jgi:hypothetical protein
VHVADIIPTWATKDVMLAITSSLSRLAWRTWLSWNSKVITLLNHSEPYNVCKTGSSDEELQYQWRAMVKASLVEWEKLVQLQTILGEEEGNEEYLWRDVEEGNEQDEDEFDN